MKCPRCGKTLVSLRCNVCKLNIDTDELVIIGNKGRALSETIAGYVADKRKQAEDWKRAGQEAEGQKEASDREAAQRVDDAISAIGTVSFSNECERTIKHARGVYDALTGSQKAYVRKVKTLQNAEAKFESLRLAGKCDKCGLTTHHSRLFERCPICNSQKKMKGESDDIIFCAVCGHTFKDDMHRKHIIY